MKGTILLSVVGFCAFASSFSMMSSAQVAKPVSPDAVVEFERYEAYATAAYSSANQVKGSSALVGFDVGASAKLKKWFGGTVDFGDYSISSLSSGHVHPTMTTFLAGPEFYIPADNLTAFVHVMFGGAHTGGVSIGPDVSFAYAAGGGFEYFVSKRLAIRVSGDGIRSSFTTVPLEPADSPHARLNARATGGIAYRF